MKCCIKKDRQPFSLFHLMCMKNITFLFLSASMLLLNACSSAPAKFSEEKGTACMERITMPGTTPDRVECYPARVYLDPTRFHHMNEYQKNHMPPMPDLP